MSLKTARTQESIGVCRSWLIWKAHEGDNVRGRLKKKRWLEAVEVLVGSWEAGRMQRKAM